MKISLSKANADMPNHCVITCEGYEPSEVAPVLKVILNGVRPVVENVRSKKQVKYRFNLRYLDDILLAFPAAQRSAGLQRRLDRAVTDQMNGTAIKNFDIPGLWDFRNDCPAKPMDYQWAAIDMCRRYLLGLEDDAEQVEHCLENDEMGLGKTFIALAALECVEDALDHQMRVLVISTKSGKYAWRKENKNWARFDYVLLDASKQTPAQREVLIKSRPTLTIVNPEMLRGKVTWMPAEGGGREERFTPNYKAIFDQVYDVIIVDEYQKFGSPTSQQTQGLMHLQGKRWLPMSGTPYMTRPDQLWPILNKCWPGRWPDFDAFKSYLVVKQENSSGRTAGYHPAHMREVRDFMHARSIRRRTDQVLADMPKKHRITVPVELNAEQRRLYNKVRDEFMIILDDNTELKIINYLAQITRLKQACFSPELYGGSKHSTKIDELKDLVESLTSSGEKILIFSEWAKATRILQRELAEYGMAYVDGSVTGEARDREQDRFNTDEGCQLYIGTIGANAEAISLGAATAVIFTDKDPSPMKNEQATRRSALGGLRGLGSTALQVPVYELYGVDTYEERVEETQRERLSVFNVLVERDGGQRTEHSTKSIRQLLRELI